MTITIGLFDRPQDAARAVDMLYDNGFGESEIGVIAREDDVRAYIESLRPPGQGDGTGPVAGALIGGFAGMLAGVGALLIPGIGPVVAAGAFASAIGLPLAGAGIGAAAGGVAGALVDRGIAAEDAEVYQEGVKRGSVLIVVESSAGYSEEARRILIDAGAVNIDQGRTREQGAAQTHFDRDERPERDRPKTETDPLTEIEARKYST